MRGEVASAAQGGDIFAAKYVLKPIYDTVQSNFLILCFPGETAGTWRRALWATAAAAQR